MTYKFLLQPQSRRFCLLGVLVFLILGCWLPVQAQASVVVQFETSPLFLDADVKPGDSTTRTITVTNNTNNIEPISFRLDNTFSTGLADVMRAQITSSGGVVYVDTVFASLFTTPMLALGNLAPGETRVYQFTASLPSQVGNPYQLTNLGFDVVIGWSSGSTTDTPTGGGGGGGGSQFRLFNEQVANVDVPTRSATLTWNTNRPGTTYLVCGNLAGGPFTLTSLAPLFGYQFVIPEDTTLTVNHSVTQTNLLPGDYECRPASRPSTADNFTVGLPLRFSFPVGLVEGVATSTPFDQTTLAELLRQMNARPHAVRYGSVLGAGKGAFGAPTYDEWRAEIDKENERLKAQANADYSNDGSESVSKDDDVRTKGGSDRMSPTQAVIDTVARHPLVLGLLPLLFLLLGFWYWRRAK